RRSPRADDAPDRRGAAHRDDRDPADGPRDRDRGRPGQVAGGGADVPPPAPAVRHLSAVSLLPGAFPLRSRPDAGPEHWPDDDRHDVRRHRPLLQRPDAEPDHRGDLDVRRLVPARTHDVVRLYLRRRAAGTLGRRSPVRGGALPGPEFRYGTTRPALPRAPSV